MIPRKLVYIIHMFFVAPLFLYLWYRGSYQNKKIPTDVFNLLGLLGVVIFIFHGYKLLTIMK